ncbi:rod shape-determining protein RodA [Candidatus Ishikawella capsulata]|uniref:Peptidoglycan glycosyltransferase MrdB n=1 Tax=Candidatus Ishikawaella capsulata Mpkobe TaxID=476281 RepID=C5WDE8_9ENTR|nr:rod shape-determining protein RodA [Candidatus Ishikawaella capsulata]BAH83354.1 cell wall shape-determining protein [Candidatus Ishikawaella capsulata Mpkobe]
MNNKNSIWMRIHIDHLVIIIFGLLIYGFMILWSASNQNINMMELRLFQIIIGLLIMLFIAQYPPYIYQKSAPYIYGLCILLLMIVDIFGHLTKGSHRWMNLWLLHFQPSEMAKIAIPLMVASYLNRDVYPPTLKSTGIALIIIIIPTILVAIQPDLGTSVLIAFSGILVLFLSGISWILISIVMFLIIVLGPIFWFCLMHDYQRRRIRTMFNPELYRLNAGYNIIQSKIAIGSGGIWGKGFLHGTQSQLNFIPETTTDFIFSVLAEELGMIGISLLLLLYILLIIRGLIIASKAYSMFERIIASELIMMLFCYIVINISMVSGIIPVVGIPLPLISYGGSALVILMAGFGMIISIDTHS